MTLVLLCVAALALVAFATSALVGLVLWAGRGLFERLDGVAQARVLLVLSVLPAFASLTVLIAALSPSFGWIADHCLGAADPHHHPHICADHHQPSAPGAGVVFLAGGFLLTVSIAAYRVSRSLLVSSGLRRRLMRIAEPASSELVAELRVLSISAPQAFALGVFRPTVFVTRGLLSPAYREHLAAVVAHEKTHLSRRDPLRQLIAIAASGFHLPLVSKRIERALTHAHELAADAGAALHVGRIGVARALVELTRAHVGAPALSVAFCSGNVEARVRRLLDPSPATAQPGVAYIAWASVVALVLATLAAAPIHHGVEMLLGLLGA